MSKRDGFRNTVKLSDFQRKGLIDRLDGASKSACSGAKSRKGARFSFHRDNVPLLVVHPAGGVGRFLVCSRNISEGGVSLLHGGFIHTGTEVHLSLSDAAGHERHLVGVVAQCRTVHGTLHEIGVQFRERIDVTEFLDASREDMELPPGAEEAPVLDAKLLLLDQVSDSRSSRLKQLRHCGLTVAEAANVDEARTLIRSQPFDVFIIDCDHGTPMSDVKIMRDGPFDGLMVTLTDSPEISSQLPEACLKLESNLPVTDLVSRIAVYLASNANSGQEPILSQLGDDPGMAAMVQGYIHDVKRSCEQIMNAMGEADMQTIRARCQAIKTTAGGYGFPTLTRAASEALNAMDATGAVDGAITELKRLISFGGRLASRDSQSGSAD